MKKEQTEILNSPLKKFIISEDKHVHTEEEKNNRKHSHEFTFKAHFPLNLLESSNKTRNMLTRWKSKA